MTSTPRVFADFNNADPFGRIRLNTVGAKEDIAKANIELVAGLQVELYDDEEITSLGIVAYDDIEGWIAEVDWPAIYAVARQRVNKEGPE